MHNDEFSRLTDVIEMDEKESAEEAHSHESEPAGTGTDTVEKTTAEPNRESEPEVPAEGKPEEREPVEQGGDTVAKKPEAHTKKEQRDYAWKELTRKNAALKRRIRELEEANRRYGESVAKPVKPEDYEDDAKFREASFNQMFDMHDMRKNSDELERVRNELSSSEEEELQYRAQANVDLLFPTEDAKKEYSTVVSNAAKYGFGRFLSETPEGMEISDFCNNSEVGAAIVYHLAKHPNDFVALMKDTSAQRRTSRLAVLEQNIMRMYAKEPEKAPEQKPVAAPQQEKKPLPRMGNLKNTTPAGDISDDDAIAFVRAHS